MSLGTRDRGRSSLLGEASSQGSRTYDVEAVTEEENDRGIDAIADRIGLLKKITKDIHTEAETQNRVLDRLVRLCDWNDGNTQNSAPRR
mmetsp:Transcript_6149/g.38180  ORF Transcript_6149/g.38180 Transcript_6149/m.38180 type:complete len:89 (-) Transcript_6149:832-1098(-)